MWHLALAVAAGVSTPPAATAPEWVWHGRLGLLALSNAASQRSAAFELAAGGTWYALGWAGLALSYRGALRDAGNDTVGVLTTMHRLQLGAAARAQWGQVLLGAELGVHPLLTTTRLHAGGETDTSRVAYSLGSGLDVEAGLPIAGRWSTSLVLGAYQRYQRVDLVLAIAVQWAP
ncbi:MAG: hypothetical protein HYZ27_02180 [Deltaproteobacteria bacterium]|nr:hypothetical protein [Deltaproteobacteria bacterium]